MPQCKKCQIHFPNRTKIGEKVKILNKRKYCLECSPYGKHNTKRLEKVKATDRFGREIRLCKECNREFILDKSNHGWTCNSCWTNKRRFKIKEKAVAYKGGKCIDCGYNKCLRALSFHHRDPSVKLFGISGAHCRAWESVQLELDKCDLICSNCHIERHELGL